MLLSALLSPIVRIRLWLYILGVMLIIWGALQLLTFIAILWAWIPVLLGILILQFTSIVSRAASSGDMQSAVAAFEKLRLFLVIQALVSVALVVLTIYILKTMDEDALFRLLFFD